MHANAGFAVYLFVISAGCLYGAIARGSSLAYALIWLLMLGAGVVWYARRKNLLWYERR